jgi:hypothetical protein
MYELIFEKLGGIGEEGFLFKSGYQCNVFDTKVQPKWTEDELEGWMLTAVDFPWLIQKTGPSHCQGQQSGERVHMAEKVPEW